MSKYPSELQSLKFFDTELQNFEDELSKTVFLADNENENAQILKKYWESLAK